MKVSVKEYTKNVTTYWALTADQVNGTLWFMGQFSYYTNDTYRVVVEGIVGSSSAGFSGILIFNFEISG